VARLYLDGVDLCPVGRVAQARSRVERVLRNGGRAWSPPKRQSPQRARNASIRRRLPAPSARDPSAGSAFDAQSLEISLRFPEAELDAEKERSAANASPSLDTRKTSVCVVSCAVRRKPPAVQRSNRGSIHRPNHRARHTRSRPSAERPPAEQHRARTFGDEAPSSTRRESRAKAAPLERWDSWPSMDGWP